MSRKKLPKAEWVAVSAKPLRETIGIRAPNTLAGRMTAIKQLEDGFEVPFEHGRCLGLTPTLFGSQISFTPDGDFVSLEDARKSIQWYAQQLGGTVKWD